MLNKSKSRITSILIAGMIVLSLIFLVYAIPSVELITPITPPNATITTNTSLQINVSIGGSDDYLDMKWNWNGTNYTLYNDSLVLMMNFDNNSAIGENSTYVVDVSTYGNNGTVNGGAFYNSSGKYGGAYQFDGDGDYIDLGNSGKLSVSQAFSIEAWINVPAISNDQLNAIVSSQKDSSVSGVGIIFDTRLNPDGQTSPRRHIHFQIGDGSWHTSNVNAVIPTSQWTHIVATRKANEDAKVYYNGILQPITSVAWTGNVNYDSNWYIGKQGDQGRYFKGLIDGVRIWNISLTASEVYQEYVSSLQKYNSTNWYLYVNQSKNSTNGLDTGTYTYFSSAKDSSENETVSEKRTFIVSNDLTNPLINFTNSTPVNATTTTNTSFIVNVTISEPNLNDMKYNFNGANFTMYNNSLVLMMNFDNSSIFGEGETNKTYDASKYGNNGTCYNMSAPGCNWTSGKYGRGIYFDGSDDYIDLGNNLNLNIAGSMTLSLWMKTIDAGYDFIVSGYNPGGANEGYALTKSAITSQKLSVWTGGASWITGTTSIADGNWHHVSFTTSGTNCILYVDGKVDGSGNINGLTSYSGNKLIGQYIGGGDYYFNGTLDELRVWNRSLSASEIYQEYTSNLNKFNETSWYLYINQSKNATEGLDNGTYTYYAYVKDIGENENNTETRTIIIGTSGSGADSIYPTFSNNLTFPANNSEYAPNQLVQFNATIANTNGSAGISFDGTNYTMSNASSVFNKSFFDLSVGTYSYYFWAYGNGTSHLFNVSQTYSYTIAKNSSYILTLTPTSPITYGTSTNFVANEGGCPSQLSCSLNISDTVYGAGTISANYSTAGNTNYSASSAVATVTINKAPSQTSLIFDKTTPQEYSTTITPTCSIIAGGNEALTLTNGTSGVPETLGAGTWNINCSYAGNDNYSTSSNTTNYIINQATPSLTLTPTSPIIYGAMTDFTANKGGCPSQLSCSLNITDAIYPAGIIRANYSTEGNINYTSASTTASVTINQNTSVCQIGFNITTPQTYPYKFKVFSNCTSAFYITRNGTIVANNSEQDLSAGSYNFTVFRNDSANYTNIIDSADFTINKATPTLTFLANGGTSNLTITYPQQINVTAIATAGTVGLDKENVDYLTNNALNVTLAADSYIFRANITGNQNYSDVGYSYYNITINKGKQTAVLNINETSPITYGTYINVTCNGDLYRNNLNINSEIGQTISLGGGNYNYSCQLNTTENYTYDDNNLTFVVNKANSLVYTYLNNSRSNISIVQYTSIWLNGTLITGNGFIQSYNHSILINNGTSSIYNLTNFSTLGIFNITTIYPGNINYSGSFETWFVNVISLDTIPPNLTINLINQTTYPFIGWINLTLIANTSNDTQATWYNINLGTNTTFINQTGIHFDQVNGETKSYWIYVYANDSAGNVNSTLVYIEIAQTGPIGGDGISNPSINSNHSNNTISDTLINESVGNMTDITQFRRKIMEFSNNLFNNLNSFLFFIMVILIIALIIIYKPWKEWKI